MPSPTRRTLALLRREGAIAEVVERFIHHVQRRRDLFHFADVISADPVAKTITLVQTTTVGHLADRLAKVQGSLEAAIWLRSGGRIELHGWDGPRLRRVELRGEDLQPVTLLQPRRRKKDRQPSLFDQTP